jgi:DNA-binding transcriptional regulator LsrR (DeoR family)
VRLEAIGLAHRADETRSFPWPVTQTLLSEAAGMSAVHVNRTLQELRASRLISTRHGAVTIPSWERLEEVAGFDPDYLSIEEIQAQLQDGECPSRSRFANVAATALPD